MKQKLYPKKLQLSLDTFVQRMKLLNRADNPQLVAKIVLKWTQEQALLTKNLLQYVLQSEFRINEGEEASAVERVIRNRLLKEFKQDDLTLNIRKEVYRRDIENLLEIKQGKLERKDWIFLARIQKSLGLSDRQARLINNEKISLNSYSPINYGDRTNSYKNNIHQMSFVPGIGSGSWETPDICEQSELITQPFYESETKSSSKKPLPIKWILLFLWTPFLFLSLKGLDSARKYWLTAIDAPSLEQQKLCVDLTSRKSPRMSLGEKLLTKGQQYNQLSSSAMMATYEGMAAFSRCEFSAAQNKYQQSIEITKNNPEALIYRNNAKAIAQDHFKIAVSVPLGSKPDIAWEILRGVAQAQTEINRDGGVNQKPLLVQIVNDDNDPHIVEQLAKQLAADENILAVVGHNDSNSSIAGAKIYEREKLTMISPTSTSTKLSGMGSHIMRTIPSVSALAGKLADYAADKSLTKVAICSDSQDSASGSFAKEFTDRAATNGGQIQPINCDFAQQDFQADSVVKNAVALNADALLLAPSVNKMDLAISVARSNQQQLPLLGNHSLYTYETIESGQNAISGMVIPSPWLADRASHSNFPQKAIQYWGGQVNWRTAMTYDAVGAIAKGLKQSNNRSQLQSVLTQTDFTVDGATGKFKFEQGDRLGEVQLAHIAKSNTGGKYQFSRLKI